MNESPATFPVALIYQQCTLGTARIEPATLGSMIPCAASLPCAGFAASCAQPPAKDFESLKRPTTRSAAPMRINRFCRVVHAWSNPSNSNLRLERRAAPQSVDERPGRSPTPLRVSGEQESPLTQFVAELAIHHYGNLHNGQIFHSGSHHD
jgi:hypothetical protein